VTRLCIAFRESQRFPRPISAKKIGLLLNTDGKTVWTHSKHFQRHGLADVENGQSPILSDEQLNQAVKRAMQPFYAMQLITPARLLYVIHSEYVIDISNVR
jgi:hypothetical protein